MPLGVLGVDLASSSWEANGTALLTFEPDGDWLGVDIDVAEWPGSGRPTATDLADRVAALCLERDIAAVSIDGPQGWRDPAAVREMRVCEQALATPGKTGAPGSCKPPSALPWVELSIAVFDRLLAGGRAELVNDPSVRRLPRPAGDRFYLLECFPSSTWRRAAIRALPAKRRRPDVAEYGRVLSNAFGLPKLTATRHDDLQAVVAALPAVALLGGPAEPVASGMPMWEIDGRRVEGLIWDAAPLKRTDARDLPLLVLVTGPPGAGKTTVAEPLARELALPLIARDELKEALYEELGTGDVEWTRRLGSATFALLRIIAARLLEAGSGAVLEANFFRGVSERAFEGLPPHRLVQVHCSAPVDVVLERYEQRAGRHPGHLDDRRRDELVTRLGDGGHDPLELPGRVLRIDTTSPVDVAAVAKRIRA